MVFKLAGDIHEEAIGLEGSQLFNPSGKKRPMKEWMQVSFDNKDKWTKFAKAALKYVNTNDSESEKKTESVFILKFAYS